MIIRCSVFREPSASFLEHFPHTFEVELQCGVISALPLVSVKDRVLLLDVPESDRMFWLGFVAGKNFACTSVLF